ncbi:hypothetical protein GCM10007862_06920 [Dyella lipolytica]|uniref:Uncharacterized protein n=1 Tax=Dyella lipolytica TaxID=1867835 RepID=A0ABW8J1Q2_9GAMM|nr:hypothetical protein [Dyella lipolytica]GLQ45641.1 hypothetical protein GCM10007862_06920 [Dyella lipolytica]
MRILVAAIFGGIVMFLWGGVAHMVLGLGNPGIHQPVHEDAVISTLHEGLGSQPGVYILPSFDPNKWNDQAARAAYAQKSMASPYAWVVYLPQGEDMTNMSRQLPRQWASDTLAALALAFLMGLAAFGFAKRMGIAVVAALFAWLSVLVPYWNWYRFPGALTWAALAEQLIGWLLAGAVMAWWLGRRERKTA